MGTNSLCTYSFQVDSPHETLQHTVSFKSSCVQQIVQCIDLILAADVHRAGGMFVICLYCTQLNEDGVCGMCEECMIMS